MRATVFAWFVAAPLVIVAGCFEVGVIDVVPVGSGSGSATSSSSSSGSGGIGGMGATGGMGSTGGSGGAGGMTSSSSSSSSGTGGTGGAMATCPTVANTPSMVLIDGVQKFCIDSTEVTNSQYKAWLLTSPDVANQVAQCISNAFLPMSGEPPQDDKPVVNVDWCDAHAFCAANGKRLCGKIGGAENAWADYNKPGLSQWHKACTNDGAQLYPYGNVYDIPACNVGDLQPDAGPSAAWPVKTGAGCVGGYPGLFDMSGNVWEWEDSCDTASTKCRRRGGSYTSDLNNVDCAVGGTLDRLSFSTNTGFRCCADLP